MANKKEELILNWVPVAFSRDVLELPFRNKKDTKLESHKLYKGITAIDEYGETEKLSGNFLFKGELIQDDHDIIQVDINNRDNTFLINEVISRAVSKGLSEIGYKVTENFGSQFSVIDLHSDRQVIPEVRVYDEYIFKPHYVYSRDEKKVTYGFIVNYKNSYEITVGEDELEFFKNSLVLIQDDSDYEKGILKLINEDDKSGVIEFREKTDNNQFRYFENSFDLKSLSPVGSISNYYRLLKSKYSNRFEEINNKRKQIVGLITPNGEINVNRQHDKYNLINTFLKRFKGDQYFKLFDNSETYFKIQNNFLDILKKNSNEISIFGSRLNKRRFIFDENKPTSNIGQYQGIRKYGPYKGLDNPEEIEYLFIYPSGNNNSANSLYFALKNGLGSFPGIESYFKMSINKDSLHKIEVEKNGTDLRSRTASYYKAVKTYLETTDGLVGSNTIAFIIFPETKPSEYPNPYYAVKALLLKHGITSQAVNIETINSSNFKWSIGNIALATFAKLGGIPWRVENKSSANQLIFGVGRKYLYDQDDNSLNKIVGFTLCITPEGEFKSISTFSPFESEQTYLENLSNQVEQSIQGVLKNSEEIDEIIVHFPKRSSYRERSSIKRALENLSENEGYLFPFATVRVTDGDPYQIWDKSHRTFLPKEGNFTFIKPQDALLVVPGRQDKQSLAGVPKSPIRVSLDSSNLPSTNFKQLLTQTYALSGANWRGFNAREMPITIFYSELIAELMGRLSKYEINFEEGLDKLKNTPWFL
ncbi:Piwi domain-containing protein [Fodinibius salsisoli]|uniref:Protein argonaute n=1 Tax=Fodinibius salsisoli TaxID=2820877 RepID=A0ABT3PIL8_9BACT|nr:Piwi domain-containing protein [Fodinibius salsisoli]MCW9705772.1 hypothetical protein [Fodinibius salsisoli]